MFSSKAAQILAEYTLMLSVPLKPYEPSLPQGKVVIYIDSET